MRIDFIFSPILDQVVAFRLSSANVVTALVRCSALESPEVLISEPFLPNFLALRFIFYYYCSGISTKQSQIFSIQLVNLLGNSASLKV